MPFEDEEEYVQDNQTGVKLKRLEPTTVNKVVAAKRLDEKAKTLSSNERVLAEKVFKASEKFKKVLNDTTLPQNRTDIQKSIEEEALKELVQIASELNQDDTKEESFGSLSLCSYLLKIVLKQRDTITLLDYRLTQLEKKNG